MKNLISNLAVSATFILALLSCDKDDKQTKTDTISFEDIVLNESGFYNGSDGSGGFSTGNAFFKTSYYSEYDSWSGFAVSNHTDTITPDFSNQYSSVAGSGAGNTAQYALLYSFSEDTIVFTIPAKVSNIAISNSSYAYYTMKNGNAFAKKFGGETGNDPDYFNLYFSVVDTKGNRINFNPVPLADFTFTDNSNDYISKEWEYYDLSNAGYVKYLIFSFASSDTSAWGINTPTYVCIDNIVDEWEE